MDESCRLDPASDSHLHRVLGDYARRIAAGEPISQADLISENPAIADALRSHFGFVEKRAPATPSDEQSSDSHTLYVPLPDRMTIPPRTPPANSATLPSQFGRYRIGRCLGEGAMGAVYLADDTQLDRPVALKIPKFTQSGDTELIERFFREARAAATVRHSNLCPVYDAGEIDGIQYLSMAFIEGEPLSEVLAKDGSPSPRDAALLVLKLAKAIAAAHAAGVIHRDLKPANIMIDGHQEPVVMDFGLARRLDKQDSRLTQSGLLMGSPAYMSPEQVEGDSEKMGPACDIYSLGIIFYELLTGDVPFQGSIAAVMGQIITAAPKQPSIIRPEIDASLEAICLTMIAKRPEDRFASMRDVVAALERYVARQPTGIVAPNAVALETTRGKVSGKHSPGGIVIAPWMLITAVAVVIGGFGVTWHFIATIMKQPPPDEIKIDASMQKKFASGAASVLLDNNALSEEQLKQPIVLKGGTHTIEISDGNGQGTSRTIKSDPDDPVVLEKTSKDITFKPAQRRMAEWVLSQGGKIQLVDAERVIDNRDFLPEGKTRIAEIDLAGIASIAPEKIEEMKSLTSSLRKLVLPKTVVTPTQINELRKALPNCAIEWAN